MARSRPIVVAGVPEHFNLPWKLAIAQGDFKRAGLDVEWVDEPGGTGALTAALSDRRVDLATVLTEGFVAAHDRGLDATLERVYVASPLYWGIHVRASRAGDRVDEFRDATFAISRLGSGSHLMAYVLAAQHGWTPKREHFVVCGGLAGGVAAVEAGDADVFLWETFMTKPDVDARRLARIGEIPTPWPSFVSVRRRGFGAPRAQAVLDVVERVAAEFIGSPNAAATVARHIGIRVEDAATWIGRTRFAQRERFSARQIAEVRAQLTAAGVVDMPLAAAGTSSGRGSARHV